MVPDLNAEVAAVASLPKKMRLARWLISVQASGTASDYYTLPEPHLYAKIAVAYGCPRTEADYISLPKQYVWADIYNTITGTTNGDRARVEREALGWILAAEYGVTGNSGLVAYYISLPIKIQIALLCGFLGGTIALTATEAGSTVITLNWTYSGTIQDQFLIERSTDNVNFTQIATVAGNVFTYNDTGLTPATLYFYRVRAKSGIGFSAYANTASESGFVPDDLPNLAAWYSADFGVLNQIGGATAFSAANSQFLQSGATSLNPANQSAAFSFWFRFDVNPDANQRVLWKRTVNNGFDFVFITSRVFNLFLGDGTNFIAPSLGPVLVAGQWYHIYIEINRSTNQLRLSVNNGAFDSSSIAAITGSINPAANFFLGSINGSSGFLNGQIDELAYFSRVLTSDEQTFLFNNGFGRTYSEAPDALKSGLVSWWSMAAPGSGNWIDSHGTNNLTPSASRPTSADGVTLKDATNGQTVRRWVDRSANARNIDQSILANQPVFSLSGGPNGMPEVVGDGVNSFIANIAGFPNVAPGTIYLVMRQISWANGRRVFDTANAGSRFGGGQRNPTPSISCSSDNQITSGELAIGTNGIFMHRVSGATGTGFIRVNDNAETSATIPVALTSSNSFSLFGTTAAAGANVAISECLLYSASHNAATQSRVRNYLRAIYFP